MPTTMPQLIGNWEKISRSACSQVYPDAIQFHDSGSYSGQKDPPGTFTQWDVGTFEVVSPGVIRISLANDAIMPYQFGIRDDTLTFKDPNGCEYVYRKVQQ